MNNAGKYTLLLMRDDTGVRRLRVGTGWIKFLLFFLLLIVICGGLSIWLGSRLWFENAALRTELTTLQQQTADMQVRLEQLATYEYILKNADPNERNDILSSIVLPDSAAGTAEQTDQPAGQNGDPATGQAAGQSSQAGTQTAGLHDAAAGSATATAAAGSTPSTPNAGSAAGSGTAPDTAAASNLPAVVDEGKLTLDNLLARTVSSDTRIELAYDMVNLDNRNRAEGRLLLYVVTADNQVHQLQLSPSASLFSMNARKIVSRFSVPLPEAARGGSAVKLMAEMLLGQSIAFRQFYTLPVTP